MGRNFKEITQPPASTQSANSTSVSKNRQSLHQMYAGDQGLLPGLCWSLQTASTAVRFLLRASAPAWTPPAPQPEVPLLLIFTCLAPPYSPWLTGVSVPPECVSSHFIRATPIPNSHSLSPDPIDSGHNTHYYTEKLASSVLHTKVKTLSCSSWHFYPAHGQAHSGFSEHWKEKSREK